MVEYCTFIAPTPFVLLPLCSASSQILGAKAPLSRA